LPTGHGFCTHFAPNSRLIDLVIRRWEYIDWITRTTSMLISTEPPYKGFKPATFYNDAGKLNFILECNRGMNCRGKPTNYRYSSLIYDIGAGAVLQHERSCYNP
jgi:hypothetical protein